MIWQWVTMDSGNIFVPVAMDGRLVRRPRSIAETPERKAVELFSGFMGWSVASTLMGLETLICIEANPEVAEAAALAHGLPVKQLDNVWSQFISNGQVDAPAIWIADVRDHRIKLLLSILEVAHAWASPPCPPWCGMASLQGLNCDDGMLLPLTIRCARDIGLVSLVMENARSLKHHPHFGHVRNFAEELGFNLVQDSVENCTGVLPLNRCRWLGCLVCHTACIRHVITHNIKTAREMQLPNDPFLGGLRGCHAILRCLSPEDIQELMPCNKAIEYMSDPKLVPSWWGQGRKLCSHDEVFKSRVTSQGSVMQGLVASYGKQHEFKYEYLEAKGLCTTLIDTPQGPRYFSPWEQAAALGHQEGIRLPKDLMKAWHIMGNALSVAHGLLQLSRLHVLLGSVSPFGTNVSPLSTLCRAMQRKVIRLECMKQVIVDDSRILVPAGGDEFPSDEGFVPSPKRARIEVGNDISPTIPFKVDELALKPVPCEASGPEPCIRGFQSMPAAVRAELDCMMLCANQHVVKMTDGFDLPPFCLSSLVARWVKIGWIEENASVLAMFMNIFPHIATGLVDTLTINDEVVCMSECPVALPFRVVQFRPIQKLCSVYVPHMGKSVIVEADITTTVHSILSEIAVTLKVPTKSLTLSCVGRSMSPDDFVLSGPNWQKFDLTWTPLCSVVPFNPKPDVTDVKHCILGDVEIGRHGVGVESNAIRIAAKHPVWGTIRTVAFVDDWPLRVVIEKLFPDITMGPMPVFRQGDRCLFGQIKLSQVSVGEPVFVDLNCAKPWPTIRLDVIPVFLHPTLAKNDERTQGQFIRDIQSPFKVRSEPRKCFGDTTLQALGGAYFLGNTTTQTILVCIRNRLVDPTLTIRETPRDATIVFKCVPLPGGAKNEVNAILAKTLSKRGVGEDVVDARVKHILSEIPLDEIKPHCEEEESQFWSSLKQLANQYRVRLITNSELKIYQRTQRGNKGAKVDSAAASSKDVGKGKGKGKHHEPKSARKVDLARVKLELQYLKTSDGSSLSVISKEQVAQDMTGITLMTKEEAQNFLPAKSMSPGPLAILAVTSPESIDEPVTMVPATDASGSPILLPVVIHNFGDVPVTMKGVESPVVTQKVPTQVIEVFVRRQHVKDWLVVRDSLNYLGKIIANMPEGALVAHWAFKSYGSDKKVATFDKAQYVHGFIRAKAEHVDCILKASGKGGIFMIPKDESRKPDPNFMIIPAGSEKLDHLLLQLQKSSQALGIVEYREGYAYRCRREHCQLVRKTLVPNSLWAEEGQARPGDSLYIVKYVQTNTGPPQLTAALKSLGWDAEAIRPLGPTTWSVAAATPPPHPHLPLDGSFAIAVPVHNPGKRELCAWTGHLKLPAAVVAEVDQKEDAMETETSATTRMSDIKAELKTEFNEQVERMIQQKLKPTQDQVTLLTETVKAQETKAAQFHAQTVDALTSLQAQQTTAETRMGSLEQTISGVSQNVVSQMNGMLQTMQNALISRLDALENSDGTKRPRKDGQL